MMARVWQYKPLSTQRIFHQISPRPSFGRFASKPKCSVKKHYHLYGKHALWAKTKLIETFQSKYRSKQNYFLVFLTFLAFGGSVFWSSSAAAVDLPLRFLVVSLSSVSPALAGFTGADLAAAGFAAADLAAAADFAFAFAVGIFSALSEMGLCWAIG